AAGPSSPGADRGCSAALTHWRLRREKPQQGNLRRREDAHRWTPEPGSAAHVQLRLTSPVEAGDVRLDQRDEPGERPDLPAVRVSAERERNAVPRRLAELARLVGEEDDGPGWVAPVERGRQVGSVAATPRRIVDAGHVAPGSGLDPLVGERPGPERRQVAQPVVDAGVVHV